jgi:hypothetical protein
MKNLVPGRRLLGRLGAVIIAPVTELAEAREVERDADVLAVGGDDFSSGVVGGDVADIVDEPNEPTSRIDGAVGAGVNVEGGVGGRVGKEAQVFGDKRIVV